MYLPSALVFQSADVRAESTLNSSPSPSLNVSGNFMTDPNTLDDIRDIFSILHDGTTSSWTGDKDLLMLKVNCDYLAERIDKSFKSFYVECRQIDKLELHPWMNPIDLPQTLLTDFNDIFKAELEILSADIENDFVKITCNQHDTDFDYCGGTLLFSC
ncbi:MAG: hypothetical protein WAU24_04195 [Chitinophagaceae bacterium]